METWIKTERELMISIMYRSILFSRILFSILFSIMNFE